MARHDTMKMPKAPRSPSTRKSRLRMALGRVFCRRNIIIISEHKTQHLPVHPVFQLVCLTGFITLITWFAYSTGSYVTAQQVLKEKDKKLATTSEENARIGAEFALLRRDLVKMLEEGNDEDMGEYAKMMTEQYNADGTPVSVATAKTKRGIDQSVIMSRIEYLENRVKELQETHNGMIADIRATTGGKIKEFETIIARTGVKADALVRSAEAKIKREEQARERYNRTREAANADEPRGGPYVPERTGTMLRETDTNLYFNIKRMMVLNEVVGGMPLARPIGKARVTSGYGTRIDPFNGRLAQHTGLDFVGSYGTDILASADGVVKDAGWQSGYGKAIDVTHGYGFSSKYAHLSAIVVKPGQRVKKGQVIGKQGSTGRSTGSHLHYEVRYNDRPLNPKNFLTAAN